MNVLEEATVELQVPGINTPVHLYVHGEHDRHVSQKLREEGVWEPYETRLLLSILKGGGAFVDVGANIGYFTLLAAYSVGPDGCVIAVEPDPDNCRLLAGSVELNGFGSRVELVEGALSETDGEGRLYLSDDNLGDHQIYAGEEQRPSVGIKLYRGSELLAGRVPHIDLLKVDTQGSECQVIEGLLPYLRGLSQVPYIVIELTPYSLAEARASGRQLIELLASLCDYMAIIDHLEHRLVECPAPELASWCDNVAATPGDRGFMNILCGPRAPDT